MDAAAAAWTPLVDQARALGRDPDLADLTDDDVERQVRDGAARLAALTCRWLVHVAELVVRDVWAEDGVRTPGAWLSWRCGVAGPTARQYVQVALALRRLPLIRARFEAGTISYSKVRAISRVAVPETQELLLELCDKAPASHVERIVAACRRQVAEFERWEHGVPARSVTAAWDFTRRQVDPDVVEYRIRLPSDEALAFDARLDRLADRTDPSSADDGPASSSEVGHVDESRADDARADDATGTASTRADGSTGGDSSAPGEDVVPYVPVAVRRARAVCDAMAVAVAADAPDRSGADDHLVVLHVDADELLPGSADSRETASAGSVGGDPGASAGSVGGDSGASAGSVGGGPGASAGSVGGGPGASAGSVDGGPGASAGSVDGGTLVPVVVGGRSTSLRRAVLDTLTCDADLRLVAEFRDGSPGHPADLGRRDRRVPSALRRAVLLRDRHCRFPGCHHARRLHAHHVVHWQDGGRTDLGNLVALCGFHHRFVHRHGWDLRPLPGCPGRWTFHGPKSAPPDSAPPDSAPPDSAPPDSSSDGASPGARSHRAEAHPAAPPLDGASAETASAEALASSPRPDALEPDEWDGDYDLSLTVAMFSRELLDLDPGRALAA